MTAKRIGLRRRYRQYWLYATKKKPTKPGLSASHKDALAEGRRQAMQCAGTLSRWNGQSHVVGARPARMR